MKSSAPGDRGAIARESRTNRSSRICRRPLASASSGAAARSPAARTHRVSRKYACAGIPFTRKSHAPSTGPGPRASVPKHG